MPRPNRQDHPGAWHHVYARGIARRTVFEHRADIRVFQARLALEVRRGTLEVHALCCLTTHVHMLVRSPTGELSKALRRVFLAYVRWFNRSRRRDGSLFRGRFGSRPVQSDIDRLNVIAYIDANPVQARIVARARDYPHGSAGYWAAGKAPPWFATWFVAEILGNKGPGAPGARAAYEKELGPRRTPALGRLIEARLERRHAEPDPLDDLVSGASKEVHAWMVKKAALADQTKPGLPVLDAESAQAAWSAARATFPGGGPEVAAALVRGWSAIARVALLRDLAGLRYDAIARRVSVSGSEARKRYRLHAQRVAEDASYAAAFSTLIRDAVRSIHRIVRTPRSRKATRS